MVAMQETGDGREPRRRPQIDRDEIDEWVEALDQVVEREGSAQAAAIAQAVQQRARARGVPVPTVSLTDDVNTLPSELEPEFPADEALERRIEAYARWNAAAM